MRKSRDPKNLLNLWRIEVDLVYFCKVSQRSQTVFVLMALNPKPIYFDNLRGYTDTVRSLLPGDTLELKVSSPNEYEIQAVKPGPDVNPSNYDILNWDWTGPTTAARQSVSPGSCVRIENSL